MATVNVSLTENSTVNNITGQIYDHTPINWIALGMFIGIITFNILVIVLLRRRQKRSRMAFFVQNLAVSDICVGVFYLLPELLVNYFVLVLWSPASCAAYGYLHMMSFHVSTNAIVVLTIDRAFVIQCPLSTISKTRRYRYGLALTAWIVGMLCSIPYSIFYKLNDMSCYNYPADVEADLWISASLLIFIPVIVIVICYSIMVQQIQKRNNGFFVLHKDDNTQNTRHQVMISKTKIRTIKLLLIVVIVYIICWGPIFIASIFQLYGAVKYMKWISTSYALAPLNSLANPIIFLLFNRKMFLKKRQTGKGNYLKPKSTVTGGHHSETEVSLA